MTKAQKTYWHLAGAHRIPSEYEIATSRLLYYQGRGFEVDVPLGPWYARHQQASPFFHGVDWEAFADPRQTSYTRYTALQRDKEIFAEALMQRIEVDAYAAGLPASWLSELATEIGALRFACHGLQMIAGYVGSMAPASRIAIAAALQAADEMRRVQWLSYRLRLLQLAGVKAADTERVRAVWQTDPAWQPLRRAIEMLMVTYDWGEAFVALNLVLKPALDEHMLARGAERANAHGDVLWAQLLSSLAEDAGWHAAWSDALRQLAATSTTAGAAIGDWTAVWQPRAAAAVNALDPSSVGEPASDDVSAACRARPGPPADPPSRRRAPPPSRGSPPEPAAT
jgi:hypothetical protein